MKHAFTFIVACLSLYSLQAHGQRMTNCRIDPFRPGESQQIYISVEGIFGSPGYTLYSDCSEPCSCVPDEENVFHINLSFQRPTNVVIQVFTPWQATTEVCGLTESVYSVRFTLTDLKSGSVEIKETSFGVRGSPQPKLVDVSHDQDQNEIQFSWQGLSTSMYTVQSCTNLLVNHWSDVPGYVDMSGRGMSLNYSESGLGESQFLRLLMKSK